MRMRRPPLAVLLALLAALPLGAQDVPPVGDSGPAPAVDLSGQFIDGPRRQENVGSCHAFATVALLEAAYFRRYGEKKRLSEADLFLQKTLLTRSAYHDFVWGGPPKLSEPNNTRRDIEFALSSGVASSLAYGDFLERYRGYRAAEERTLAAVRDIPQEPGDEPRREWSDLQQSALSRRLIEDRLTGGRSGKLAGEREENRRAFEGFRLKTRDFDDWGWFSDGAEQSAAASEELDAGRPVAVVVPGHVLVLTGYHDREDGERVFHARDSDGSKEFADRDMNMVLSILSVREPRGRKKVTPRLQTPA
jgi:hypothetical protein